MAATLDLYSPPTSKFPFPSCSSLLQNSCTTRSCVVLDGFRGGDGEIKKRQKKKFITREEEPEQYWQTAGERGENSMKNPLPYIIIFGMSTPFVILAIAFASGWIKVPVR